MNLLSIYLPIYVSSNSPTHPIIHLPTYPLIHTLTHLLPASTVKSPIFLSTIHASTHHLSIGNHHLPSASPSTHSPISLSIHLLSTYQTSTTDSDTWISLHPFIYLLVHQSAPPSTHRYTTPLYPSSIQFFLFHPSIFPPTQIIHTLFTQPSTYQSIHLPPLLLNHLIPTTIGK